MWADSEILSLEIWILWLRSFSSSHYVSLAATLIPFPTLWPSFYRAVHSACVPSLPIYTVPVWFQSHHPQQLTPTWSFCYSRFFSPHFTWLVSNIWLCYLCFPTWNSILLGFLTSFSFCHTPTYLEALYYNFFQTYVLPSWVPALPLFLVIFSLEKLCMLLAFTTISILVTSKCIYMSSLDLSFELQIHSLTVNLITSVDNWSHFKFNIFNMTSWLPPLNLSSPVALVRNWRVVIDTFFLIFNI